MRFFCASIVGDVLTDPKHSLRSRGQLSSCMAYTLRCCVRRRLTTTEKSLFLERPSNRIFSKEPLINVCEAVSAAKVAALGEAKISEPKRSEDGTRRVSSFSCVQKAQFIAHK